MSSPMEQPAAWPTDDDVPVEELARRQGVRPVASLDERSPSSGSPSRSSRRSSPILTPRGGPTSRSFVIPDTDVASAVLHGRVPDSLALRLTGQSRDGG